MKLSPFIFLAILCIFVLPVNAATMSIAANAFGIGNYIPPSGFTGDQDNLFVFGNNTQLLRSDHLLGGTTAIMYNIPGQVSDVEARSDYIYIVLADGRTYKLTHYLGYKNFNTYVFSGDNVDAYLLGDFSTDTYCRQKICVDDAGNIFVSSGKDDKIYKIDGTTHVSIEYYTNLQSTSLVSIPMYAGYNDLLVLRSVSTTSIEIGKINTKDTYSSIFAFSGATSWKPYSVTQLQNRNYIVSALTDSTTDTLYIYEANQTAIIGTITSYTKTSLPLIYDDTVVLQNGVVVHLDGATHYITTYSSVSGSGGYIPSNDGTSAPEITYNAKDVFAEYKTYYNQTNVRFLWSLAIDDEFINTYNTVYSEPIYNRYYWRIELFSPDNIFINSYILPTNWKYQKYTLGIFGSGDYINSGNVQFNNIVGNGTYTVKIYEINRITGAKAFLDSDTFVILSQTNPSGSGGIMETSGESAAYNFLNSPYLVAIIIIGVVGFQFGRGRDGNINGSAMIVLIPLAVGLCALMGILPMWILYVMVLCIIAFVAVKMSTGGS